MKKSKDFYLTSNGKVSKHKIRGSEIIGHGLIHDDQVLVVDTNKRIIKYFYNEIKVGTHLQKDLVHLYEGEFIEKIEIITIREKKGYEV